MQGGVQLTWVQLDTDGVQCLILVLFPFGLVFIP